LALVEAHPELRLAWLDAEARCAEARAKEAPMARYARAVALAKDVSLREWIAATLDECARHVSANVRAAALAVPEAVHQMRVAIRSYRTVLRVFREWLPEAEARSLSDELAGVAQALGEVRDWDVLIAETLEPLREREDSVEELIELARAAREDAATALSARLDSNECASVMLSLAAFVGSGAASPPERFAGAHARDSVAAALVGCQARVAKAARRVRGPAQRHRLRVRVKQGRYAAELATPLLGKVARRYARRAARLQARLGAETDADSARERIQQLAPEDARAEVRLKAAFARGWIARCGAEGRVRLRKRLARLARAAEALEHLASFASRS
jgi:CHAD domain-containing protein